MLMNPGTSSSSRNSKYGAVSKTLSHPLSAIQPMNQTSSQSKQAANNHPLQNEQPQDQQDNIDIDVGNDDYDEETDEFANYSHSTLPDSSAAAHASKQGSHGARGDQ